MPEDVLDLMSLRGLAEAAPIGAALLDPSGRYLWVNPALAELNAVTRSDHVGRDLDEVLPRPLADSARAHLRRALEVGDVGPIEGAFVFPDEPSVARTFVQRWFVVPNTAGEVRVGLLVWERPEERRSTSELRASQQRLDLVLAAGGMGLWEVDVATAEARWDRRTAAIFGIEVEDFRGTVEHFSAFVHPDDRASIAAAITRSIEDDVELFRDYRIIRPDGALRWVSSRGRLVTGDDGRRALVGSVQDRTDSRATAERLVRTLERMDDAFYRLDGQLRFVYVNARAEMVLQRHREQLLDRDLLEAFPAAEEVGLVDLYLRVIAEQKPASSELYYPPLEVWVEVRAHPDDDGVAVYFRDVTPRRLQHEREEALAAVEARARAAGARLLDAAALMLAGRSTDRAARAACRAGVTVFSCERVGLWRIGERTARLVAQHGGRPLPADLELPLEGMARMQRAVASGRPMAFGPGSEQRATAEAPAGADLTSDSAIYAPVPLGAGDALVAVMTFADEAPHGAAMLGVAARFAQQTALALEQGRRREAQADAGRLGSQLQSSLLPALGEPPPGFEIGALYQPGERRLLLGGDFSDVLIQPDGGIAMIIGDVTGHGPEAAAIGAALRAGWRALALAGATPRAALRVLDDLVRAERDTDEQLVTVCCVRVDAEAGALSIASAGHPAPLLVEPRGTTLLEVPTGVLLGLPVERLSWEEGRVQLPQRWGLLLYTDGLPEARDVLGDGDRLGFEGFRRVVAEHRLLTAEDPDAALARLQVSVRDRAGQPVEDDVALLLLRTR